MDCSLSNDFLCIPSHFIYAVIVLVELPHADNVRMVGNLLGDPLQEIEIGAPVSVVFEDHDDGDPDFTLVQWELTSNS